MRELCIYGVERASRGEDLCFQEWVKRGDPDVLDTCFGTSLLERKTLVTNPKTRSWGITRGRSCSAFLKRTTFTYVGRQDIQTEFDDAFKGLSSDAPASAKLWGNADAFGLQNSLSHSESKNTNNNSLSHSESTLTYK
jgi:hypothetical protein